MYYTKYQKQSFTTSFNFDDSEDTYFNQIIEKIGHYSYNNSKFVHIIFFVHIIHLALFRYNPAIWNIIYFFMLNN